MFNPGYFILLLGALIFFHELGHFVVAKLSGVRVLTFSIGFGPALVRWKRGDTEYRLAAIPLGGYVRMFGDEPDSSVPEEERRFAFNYAPLWRRTAIVVAGPVTNLLLPFVVFFGLFLTQAELLPSYVGAVKEGGPAWQGGIRAGDTISAVDGQEIKYWWEMEELINASAGREVEIAVTRGPESFTTRVVPETVEVVKLRHVGLIEKEGRIQVIPLSLDPVLGVEMGSAAYEAGLRNWDRVVRINGKPVKAFVEVQAVMDAGQPATLEVIGEEPLGRVGHARFNRYGAPRTYALAPEQFEGLASAELVVHHVDAGSPADQLGLKPGNRIVSIDGESFPLWFIFESYLAEHVGESHKLTWTDGESDWTIAFTLNPSTEKGEFNEDRQVVVFGAYNHASVSSPDLLPNESRVFYAAHETWKRTLEAYKVTIASVAGLVVGKVPIKEMGGPILIYDMASKTEKYGWEYFFNILVWLSISLGVINLFPVPILDGGHLLFFAIEAVIGRPVPIRVRQIAAYVGLALIILLMVVVFHNDIMRNWDAIVNWF
jgi:regulator of sigma E protease